MSQRQALLASAVSFAHLNGVVAVPQPPAPAAAAPAPAVDAGGDDDEEAKKQAAADKKARRKAKTSKRDADDDGGDDPDDDDSDDDEDMRAGVTGRARMRERRRIAAIMACPAAAKNVAFAVHLACNTAMPKGVAIQVLTDAVAHAPVTRRGTLDASMAAAAIPPVPANAPPKAAQSPADRALALARSTGRHV